MEQPQARRRRSDRIQYDAQNAMQVDGNVSLPNTPAPQAVTGAQPRFYPPQGQMPQGQMAQGQMLQGQVGQVQQGQMPANQVLQGQMPQSRRTRGQMAQGQVPQSQMAQSQFPQSQNLQGQMGQGQVPQGQMPQGQVSQGQMVQGQIPQGQLSQAQLSQSQMMQRQMPQSAPRPQVQQPVGQQGYPQGAYPQEAWSNSRQMQPIVRQPARVYPPTLGQEISQTVSGQSPMPYQTGVVPSQSMEWQALPSVPPTPPVTGGPGGPTPPPEEPSQPPFWQTFAFRVAALVLAGILVIVLCARGVTGYRAAQERKALEASVQAYDDLFCQGVYVDGLHLGGMTQQEATDAVLRQANEKRNAWSVTLRYGEQTWVVNADQLGMQIHLADAMDSAWAQGHNGTIDERRAAMDQLAITPFHGYTTLPGGDTSVLDSLLAGIAEAVNQPVQDASILAFDASLTYPFTFQEEQPGYTLDVASLRERLYQMVSSMESGTLTIEPQVTEPTVTVEQLKRTKLAVRGEGLTEVSSTSTQERNDNIKRSFELVSGTVLKPGDVFSFNGVVGERSVRNGFKSAIEYRNGKEETGIGGGVCQSSTTIYQAAVTAGLEIVEREPHGMEVNYCEYGKDATVNWVKGHMIDLKFRNNTESDLYIKATMDWNPSRKRWVTHVTLYGEPMPDGVRYDFDVQQELLPAPIDTKYVKDTKQQYVVYTDEEHEAQAAKDGLEVTSYQVKYENGREVSRVELGVDTFAPKQRIVYVGVTDY